MSATTARLSPIRQLLAARRERRHLERELATYTSPSERLELEAILDRYPAEETEDIRAILIRQSVEREAHETAPAFLGAGGRK